MAKKYLVGLREGALQCIGDMGLLQPKMECDLYEDVLPWLLAKRDEFLGDQESAVSLSSKIIEKGIL